MEVTIIINSESDREQHGRFVHVLLLQNGEQFRIGVAEERFDARTGYEPIEKTIARAMNQAAQWLNAGPVNLRNAGKHVARQ